MTPQSVEGEDVGDLDPYGGLFDDEQTKILEIKEHLEDPDQVFFLFFFLVIAWFIFQFYLSGFDFHFGLDSLL